MPAYIRGKVGVVVGISPLYPFPDAAGHGMQAPMEPTYDVRFRSRDLWPIAATTPLIMWECSKAIWRRRQRHEEEFRSYAAF